MCSALQLSRYLLAALALSSSPLMAVPAGAPDHTAEETPHLGLRITTEAEEGLDEERESDEAEATPEEVLFQYCNAASTPTPVLEDAVKTCTDINRPLANFFHQTPLFPACVRGNQEAAELLLAYGAKAAVHDEYGYTPLMACAERNFTTLMQSLFEHDGLVSINDRDRPIGEDEADSFTYGSECARLTNAAKNSALTYAARNGHQEACKLLIQMGAEVEAELAEDTIPSAMREFIRSERAAYLYGITQTGTSSPQPPTCPCHRKA